MIMGNRVFSFKNITLQVVAVFATMMAVWSCRTDTPIRELDFKSHYGFYLLNQGNMGSNKASIDYYDYESETYFLNIFPKINPTVGFLLGDVGNDLQVYGNRLYAVINLSNMVEVMDKITGKHIGSFDIPNCRYITFRGDKAYVTSFAGPIPDAQNPSQLGYVAEIDTATLRQTRRVTVGYQPEQMQIVGDKLYVANSGGYNSPNYENTVSVIDLNSFNEIKKIEVGINLHHMVKDKEGNLYISSRGNYSSTPSNIYRLNTATEQVEALNIESSCFVLAGDSLFSIATNYNTNTNKYILYNVRTKQVLSNNFISSGLAGMIRLPYYIDYNAERQELYICDAKSFIIPGEILCFSPKGEYRWRQITGDIPSAMAFIDNR